MYVDITTVPVWARRRTVTAVDLDLDVVRGWTGRVWVDDEDEFADAPGRATAYPPIWSGWPSSCDAVRAAVAYRPGAVRRAAAGLVRVLDAVHAGAR